MMRYLSLVLCAALIGVGCGLARGEAEFEGWGDLRGFRIDGELMRVSTSLQAFRPGRKQLAYTGKWQTDGVHFTRDGDKRIYDGKIAFDDKKGFTYRYVVRDLPQDGVEIQIQFTPQADMDLEEISLGIGAPMDDYSGATVELIDAKLPTTQSSQIATTRPANERQYLFGAASGVRFTGARRQLEAYFDSPRPVMVQDHASSHGDKIMAEIELHPGNVKKDEQITATLTLRASGQVDHSPAHLTMKTAATSRPFEGIGGNLVFNLDAPVVGFNFKHLPIAWARLGVPLSEWQPGELDDPPAEGLAANDRPGSEMRTSLEMAKSLHQRGVPLIFSLWVAPSWAISNPNPADPYADTHLVLPAKWDSLGKSIASYLNYAKRQYGVEPELFSFNESDLGVTIKLTPEEHRDAIKALGASFASAGLKTRLLLGDVTNPKPVDFIQPTANDPQALQYVGAISYHSWNGGSLKQLAAWRTAAAQLNLPLLVTEGGMDPEAYDYPFICNETWYAIEEGALYLDILSQSQPAAVLPWELTSDYPLATLNGPQLVPNKRFWFLKQLTSSTGAGAIHQEIASDHAMVHAAAFSQGDGLGYTIHIVNSGASRDVTVSGIPAEISRLDCYITDATQGFQKIEAVMVESGTAHLQLPAMCFVSLTNREIAAEGAQ